MNISNRSYLSDDLVKRILKVSAEFTGANMIGFPIKINNRTADYASDTTGTVYHRIPYFMVTKFCISLPSKKSIPLYVRRKNYNKLSLIDMAIGIISTVIHECQHVADVQNKLSFTSHEVFYSDHMMRRPKWSDRPEEHRALAAEERARNENFYDKNYELVIEIAEALESIRKSENRYI